LCQVQNASSIAPKTKHLSVFRKMNLTEIKTAVMAGKTVHWASDAYVVIYAPRIEEFLIKCLLNDDCIGLTWKDGVTMNGKPSQFFVPFQKGSKPVTPRSRAKQRGTFIKCPKCGHIGCIHHFSWSALTCQGCKQLIDKYDWQQEA